MDSVHKPPILSTPHSSLYNHQKIGVLVTLLIVLLLSGCKTVPIHDRTYSVESGFWEQNEKTSMRVRNSAIPGNQTMGWIHTSGKNAVVVNSYPAKNESAVRNGSSVYTGAYSSAHIEFKKPDSGCLIVIDEFKYGKAYTDTSRCHQQIETPHAVIQAHHAVLHIGVSSQQTRIIAINGEIKATLRSDETQSIDVKSDHEVIVTHNKIHLPRHMAAEEIWLHTQWKENYPFYKTEIDWRKVTAAAATLVFVAVAAVLIPGAFRNSGNRYGSHGFRHFSR